MLKFIIAFLLFILAVFANTEMDRIQNKPHLALFHSPFWLNNLWQGRNWFIKNVFTFLLDGWHLCKFVQIFSYMGIISLLAGNIIYAPLLMLIQGIIFYLIYNR